jgi:hypothetical protein
LLAEAQGFGQDPHVFSVEERDRVREHVLAVAAADPRVVAGAEIGALALGGGDRWSDLDLTFGVDDAVPVTEVLDDWTRELERELEATHLFDLTAPHATYRVFLLPGCLQLDLSFASASAFSLGGTKFALLFGTALELPPGPPPSPHHLFGLAVHHAVRARTCVERGRWWQAEHWIAELRRHALELACLRRGLEPSHGRGFDDLPADVLSPFHDALVRSPERGELLRALAAAIAALLRESTDAGDLAAKVEARLHELTRAG